jgi:tetratricopeptide (TPR) repeat protein
MRSPGWEEVEARAPGRLEVLLEARAARCRRAGDRQGEARASRALAAARDAEARPGAVIEDLRRALALHRAQQDWVRCADVLLVWASVLRRLGRGEAAQEALVQARGLFLREREGIGLALTEVVQAGLHQDAGRTSEALSCLQRALQGAALFGLPEVAGAIWGQLAWLHHARGEEAAEEAALEAAARASALGAGEASVELWLRLGRRRRERGLLERALEALEAAQAAAGDEPRAVAFVAFERAQVGRVGGDARAVERELRRCLRVLHEGGLRDNALERAASLWLGQRMAVEGDPGEAELLLGRALDLAIEGGDREAVEAISGCLLDLGQRVGDNALRRRWQQRSRQVLEVMAARAADKEET